VGDETEVMNLLAYNGKLYAGTLPGAEVHRLDDGGWQIVGTLDRTPDVRYRRAASMAVFGGRLYSGTLPSGTVHSMTAGLVVTQDRALATGWRHVAAVREGPAVALYVDGALVDRRTAAGTLGSAETATSVPLVLGGGPRGSFEGELSRVRLFGRALAAEEVAAEARRSA
jgi:outer membrane protein assembly factor BamB